MPKKRKLVSTVLLALFFVFIALSLLTALKVPLPGPLNLLFSRQTQAQAGNSRQLPAPGGGAQAAPQRTNSGSGAPSGGTSTGAGQSANARQAPPSGGTPSGAPQSANARQGQSAGASTAQRGTVGGAASGAAGRAAISVRAVPVTLGTVENSVSVTGDVLAARQVAIYPQVSGRITELRFRIGDSVRRGDIVAYIDPSRPGEVYSANPVISTISGTILIAPYSIGDQVSTSSAIFTAGDLSSIIVETFIPERFSTAMRIGLNADAFFEALPGESFPMEISVVSPVLETASRTLRIRLKFKGAMDSRIRAGMFATVSLVTASRKDVPVIPRTALINTYGEWIVFSIDAENIAHRRVIEIGLESEETVEIKRGISKGELIVTVGQNFLSEGELVRIVE